MAIVVIKIGENEPATYSKIGKLSKHLDIIEVLPRKRDAQGKLLNRTAGIQGDKEYLCVEVDMDSLTDAEFEEARSLLRSQDIQVTEVDGKSVQTTLQKRLYKFDLAKLSLTKEVADKIAENAEKRRNHQAYDMTGLNKDIRKTKHSLATTFEGTVDKKTTTNLAVTLDVATKGAVVALRDYIQTKQTIGGIK